MRRAFVLAMLVGCAIASAHAAVFDAFTYPTSAAAQSAWINGPGSAPARPAAGGGLLLPVMFDAETSRNYWDRDIILDLSTFSNVEIELACPQPDAMRSLAVYFKSGDGWYIWNKPLVAAGRQKLVLRKTDFSIEGNPAGWNNITRIRISPWKARDASTSLILHRFAARQESLFVVQTTKSAPNAFERGTARRSAERISDWLEDGGLAHSIITEEELSRACREAAVIVLPYMPRLPDDAISGLRSFVNRGGKLMAFYSSDTRLARLMQVKLGSVTNTRDIARLRAFDFTDDAPPGVPGNVHQQSWYIGHAQPVGRQSRVIAWWADAGGKRSRDAAVIASPAGYWFTHILLGDDDRAKARMLTGLLAALDPSLWKDAADHALLSAGRIDGWLDTADAVAALDRMAAGHPSEETIRAFTRRVRSKESAMRRLYGRGHYREAVLTGYELTDTLIRAYGLAQRPRPGEICAVWEHDGAGWYPGDWDRTAKLLAESGINTIFVNTTWAGLAHYPSAIVPESFTHRYYRDQVAACVRAARKHGLSVHAWVVCWQLSNAPDEFVASNRKRGVMMKKASGEEITWMNPAHPTSRKHHLDVIRELLERYDLDGIHLDYIRYPGTDAGFSDYSRKAFTASTGLSVTDWPRDVQAGGPYQNAFQRWRADNITGFVREARELMQRIKPKATLSAAVWGGYPRVTESIAQDWMTWLRDDYVDFVCPMNYANDLYSFTALLDQQLAYPEAHGKIVPGIGVTASESQLRGDQVIEQIIALRKRGVKGFALFDLSQTLVDDTLPALRMGVTKPIAKP